MTFAELLNRNIKGFRGEYRMTIPGRDDLVLWECLSQEAITALAELLHKKKIFSLPSSMFVYAFDGRGLIHLPIAERVKPPYKTPHWAPVILHSKESFEASERDRAKRCPSKRRVSSVTAGSIPHEHGQ